MFSLYCITQYSVDSCSYQPDLNDLGLHASLLIVYALNFSRVMTMTFICCVRANFKFGHLGCLHYIGNFIILDSLCCGSLQHILVLAELKNIGAITEYLAHSPGHKSTATMFSGPLVSECEIN